MTKENEALLAKARKAASSVYLATEEEVAKDLSGILHELIECVLLLDDRLLRQAGPIRIRHPQDCAWAPHGPNADYLHPADDAKPYDVDGLTYCGKCHHFI